MTAPEAPDLTAFIRWCLEENKPSTLLYRPGVWGREKLHSSDLGEVEHGCRLKVWLRTRGAEEKPKSPGWFLMMYKANLIHLAYQEWMEAWLYTWSQGEWGVTAVEEPVYPKDPRRSGRLDLAMRHNPTGAFVIVDFKSQRAAAFKYRTDGPRASYVPQVSDYALRKGAAYSIILVTDREGSNFIDQYVVPVADTAPLWAVLEADRDGDTPPPAIAPAKKGEAPWNCSYCDFLGTSCGGAVHRWVKVPEVKP